MRAIVLPINVLIIVALGVIVLTSVIAFYYPSFTSGSEVVSLESVKSSACQSLTAKFCKEETKNIQIVNFDADKDGIAGETAENGDNLYMLCVKYYQTCTKQLLGDTNRDCIIDSYNSSEFSTICSPWFGKCPPPSPPPAVCDVAGDGPCGTSDGCVDISDILCFKWLVNKVEPGAEKACKKICGC